METRTQAEREVARRLGGRRVPAPERARGGAPDVEHRRLAVEVKHWPALPAWLRGAMAQAQAASRDGKVPVAVLHERGRPYDDALCVLRLADLARLLAGGHGHDLPAANTGPADDLGAGIARLRRGDADPEAWLAGDAERLAARLADLDGAGG